MKSYSQVILIILTVVWLKQATLQTKRILISLLLWPHKSFYCIWAIHTLRGFSTDPIIKGDGRGKPKWVSCTQSVPNALNKLIFRSL